MSEPVDVLPELTDGTVRLRPVPGGEVPGWEVLAGDVPVVTLALLPVPARPETTLLEVVESGPGPDAAVLERAAVLAVGHLLGAGGRERLEVRVPVGESEQVRALTRAGLRREGVLRETAGERVLLARLASDPPVGSGEQFRAALNAGLPLKRAIAQGLVRDAQGRVLMCELTYKPFWDLPGGVVDPGESPAAAVVREIAEELGVAARVRSLAAVSWLPPWRGWDDATLFLFELEIDPDALAGAVLQPREIRAVHWADAAEGEQRAAPYTARLVAQAVASLEAGRGTVYLEDGAPPAW